MRIQNQLQFCSQSVLMWGLYVSFAQANLLTNVFDNGECPVDASYCVQLHNIGELTYCMETLDAGESKITCSSPGLASHYSFNSFTGFESFKLLSIFTQIEMNSLCASTIWAPAIASGQDYSAIKLSEMVYRVTYGYTSNAEGEVTMTGCVSNIS